MAINPDYWRKARDEAPIHVQIRLDRRPSPGNSIVSGPIVRIFRDHANTLKLGQEITFEASCHQKQPPTAERGPAILGRQTVSLDLDWLNAAHFLEAYLEPDGNGGYLLSWDQASALLEKTKEPVNPPGGESPYGVLVTEELLRRVASPDSPRSNCWRKLFHR